MLACVIEESPRGDWPGSEKELNAKLHNLIVHIYKSLEDFSGSAKCNQCLKTEIIIKSENLNYEAWKYVFIAETFRESANIEDINKSFYKRKSV